MIEIGARVDLLHSQSPKSAIVEDAQELWSQMAAFGWFVADLSWDPFLSVAQYGPEGVMKAFLHDHRQGSSYLLSWPKTCTFVRDNSLPAMIEEYAARKDRCPACHGPLAMNGNCEQCISWGNLLLEQGAPHFVSMQVYKTEIQPADPILDPDFTITETTPCELDRIGSESSDDKVEWLCKCASATSHRKILLAYGLDHTKYDISYDPSLAVGNGRPPNLLV